ncbi:hypothetical protein PC128_g14569 [Phytophthora cactorum]|nr:hypothetical protein C6341_g14052 [Phytophthora cactorum]KAG3182637.1 hypothetical protein PC128_g14569 [Phytophthora cactorum]
MKNYTKGWTCTHGGQFKSNGQGLQGTFHVKSHDSTHNHPIDKNVFNTYAETRKITSPVTRSVVRTMRQGGAKRKTLLRYLKDISGKPIQPQYTSVKALTSHMRRMARLFPEVCIDATHGTNINRFSFMVTDKFGCGAFAQHALIDGETQQNMTNAISAFKRSNESWKVIKVLIIDKDFTELSTLEVEFPEASIILCHIHELCRGQQAVVEYLETNWLSCKERWCTFHRGEMPHLDDNTNSRLEAGWGATKDVLSRHMPMDECIETLLILYQGAEDSYKVETTRVGHRVNHNFDKEMQMLARIATHHACNIVEEQYTACQKSNYNVIASGLSSAFQPPKSKETQQNYAVNLDTNACSCVFNQTQLLPCRHIIFLRQKQARLPAIPYDTIPPRWSLLEEPDDADLSCGFTIADVGTLKPRVISHNAKYKTAFAVCQRIAEVVAAKGTACESKVRGILLVVLVKKCFTAIQNVVIRKKSKNGTDVSQNDVVVVGTF